MFEIVELTKDYIKSLVKLERLCFDEPWTEVMFSGDLKNPNTKYFSAVDKNNEVIAYAGMWIAIDEGQITNIAVHPQFRKLGVASELLKQLFVICNEKNLKSITLEVRESNLPAINLYNKLGFVTVGTRKNYYKNPVENAILMTKYFCPEGE